MKKWQIAIVVGLGALVLYQGYTVRALRAELADRGRVLRLCQQSMPTRTEVAATGRWLQDFYKSPEGLQRPQGLWINDQPDFEGISAWVLDVYVWARAEGASEADARQRIVKAIQGSDEWRTKHPAGAAAK